MTGPTADPRDLERLAREMPAFQEEMRAATMAAAEAEYEATAAVDVTAVVSGLGALRSIQIGAMAKRTLDSESLGLAVVEAVRAAEARAQAGMRERFAGITLLGVPAAGYLPKEFAGPES